MATSEQTLQLLRDQYQADERPWVVAYSGGKDSTLVLQLVFELLLDLGAAAKKPVFVLSSDTRVEAPNVARYVHENLANIEHAARSRNLNLHTRLVFPAPEEGYWSKMIGRGYPPPSRWFRWCTSTMKIRPSRRGIEDITREYGSVILLLGSRLDESSARSQSIQSHTNNEKGLNPHHEIPNALVFKPVVDWATDQVWEYLYSVPPAWGGTHDELIRLYRQANGGECPVVLDLNTPSCGGSRFGCWTCTVVKQDKSMQGFIAGGEDSMIPLNELRGRLITYRDAPGMRSNIKRDDRQGHGPFTPDGRRTILRDLLETERQAGQELISSEELGHIQRIWTEEFDFTGNDAIRIAREYDREVSMDEMAAPQAPSDEDSLIEAAAGEVDASPELLKSILGLVRQRHAELDTWGAKPRLEREIEEMLIKAARQLEDAAS